MDLLSRTLLPRFLSQLAEIDGFNIALVIFTPTTSTVGDDPSGYLGSVMTQLSSQNIREPRSLYRFLYKCVKSTGIPHLLETSASGMNFEPLLILVTGGTGFIVSDEPPFAHSLTMPFCRGVMLSLAYLTKDTAYELQTYPLTHVI